MWWLARACCCDSNIPASSTVSEYYNASNNRRICDEADGLAPRAQYLDERSATKIAHRKDSSSLYCSVTPSNKLSFQDIYALESLIAGGTLNSDRSTWIANRIKPLSTADNIVAVKIFENVNEGTAANILSEVALLKSLQHPSIARYIDFFSDVAKPSTKQLVMEFVEGGRLYDSIVLHGHYDEVTARKTVANLVDVLCFLSRERVVFRDLKPENILLVRKDDMANIKLCGFGYATKLAPGQHTTEGKWYTAGYSAPEILRSQPYAMEVDVFSFGVVAYILLTGCIPWSEETWEDDNALNSAVLAGDAKFYEDDWKPLSYNARHFVELALSNDRSNRPSIDELKIHPWLQENIQWLGNPWVSRTAWMVKKNAMRLIERPKYKSCKISREECNERKPLMSPA